MKIKTSLNDANFGSSVIQLVRNNIDSDLVLLSTAAHKEANGESQWEIKIVIRQKTDKERKSEELARRLDG